MKKITAQQARNCNPTELAFIGDSIYELLVREQVIGTKNFQTKTVAKVRASYQSDACKYILPLLTEEETEIFRRGRNANPKTIPKAASPAEYRRATAFEAVFGYLHLLGKHERIVELFEVAYDKKETAQSPDKDEKNPD